MCTCICININMCVYIYIYIYIYVFIYIQPARRLPAQPTAELPGRRPGDCAQNYIYIYIYIYTHMYTPRGDPSRTSTTAVLVRPRLSDVDRDPSGASAERPSHTKLVKVSII